MRHADLSKSCFVVSLLIGISGAESPAQSSVTVTCAANTVTVNKTVQCSAKDASGKNITNSLQWSSTLSSVANVDPKSGLVEGASPGGPIEITATDATAKTSGSAQITVESGSKLQFIEIAPVSASVAVGSTQQFRATGHYEDGSSQDLTASSLWNSSNPDMAKCDPATGVATGVAAGSTVITATLSGQNSNAAQLMVTKAAVVAAPTKDAVNAEDEQLRAKEDSCLTQWKAGCLAQYSANYQTLQKDGIAAYEAGTVTANDQAVKDAYAIKNAGDAALKNGDFSLRTSKHVSHLRALGGIDASAAASTDISARFLLDADLDLPISRSEESINGRFWGWANVKLASMASPGTISGTSNLPTYVSSLTTASPNGVVQSFEASAGPEIRIAGGNMHNGRRPIMSSFIIAAGIVTPISPSQATPPIYAAPLNLQQYYVGLPTAPNPKSYYRTNAAAVEAACGWTVSSSGPPTPPSPIQTCYITDVPQGRTSLFRNYAAGLRFKRYYYNAYEERYVFPAMADITFGQNDYVTGGQLRGLVLHAGGSTPIGGVPGVYLYAAVDVRTTARNINSQQFLLQAAPSTVSATSSDVAQLTVPQPNRDRYRFGIGLDVTKLCSAFHLCPSIPANAASTPARTP